jgi:hypothetical protein
MRKQSPVLMFLTSIAGLAVSVLSGLALVPRVRLVEVLTVIAGAVGGGAALVLSIQQFQRSRKQDRRARQVKR